MTYDDEFVIAEGPTGGPLAMLDQIDIQPFEYGLHDLARVHHPGVHWWHGYRRDDQGFGSYCYVCDRFLVRWGGNGSPPMFARHTISEHKFDHRAGTVPVANSTPREEPQQ